MAGGGMTVCVFLPASTRREGWDPKITENVGRVFKCEPATRGGLYYLKKLSLNIRRNLEAPLLLRRSFQKLTPPQKICQPPPTSTSRSTRPARPRNAVTASMAVETWSRGLADASTASSPQNSDLWGHLNRVGGMLEVVDSCVGEEPKRVRREGGVAVGLARAQDEDLRRSADGDGRAVVFLKLVVSTGGGLAHRRCRTAT
jgi:hypothetical protein